jgi:ligand-binding sensor domain-containing protein
MSGRAVSVVSLKALQPIAKTTYTVDDAKAKVLTRKILWKLDTRYFSNHEFDQLPAANDFLQSAPAYNHLISLQLL